MTTTPDPIDVWVVTHPDGHLGIFTTRQLAEDHAARFTDPRIAIETDVVRNQPMVEIDFLTEARNALAKAVDNLITNNPALAGEGDAS